MASVCSYTSISTPAAYESMYKPFNSLAMLQIQVQEQIKAIEEVSKELSKDKQATLQFLIDAGIIKQEGNPKPHQTKKH